jgi:hypothetical protein
LPETITMEYSDSDVVVTVLDGAVTMRMVKHPERAFALEATLDLVIGAEFFKQKPPHHFHINQDEYIQVLEGTLGLDMHGKENVLTKESPEFTIPAWANHRSYPLEPARQNGATKVVFLLSGEKTLEPFQLNFLFFENWYRYQSETRELGKSIDMIQVFSTFDAGGTYVTLPSWIPFGNTISRAMGIVVGRWFGAMIGYAPYYQKYSTDWDLACRQMKTSVFQKRFANHSKRD